MGGGASGGQKKKELFGFSSARSFSKGKGWGGVPAGLRGWLCKRGGGVLPVEAFPAWDGGSSGVDGEGGRRGSDGQ